MGKEGNICIIIESSTKYNGEMKHQLMVFSPQPKMFKWHEGVLKQSSILTYFLTSLELLHFVALFLGLMILGVKNLFLNFANLM
jgi:hypothetical protein